MMMMMMIDESVVLVFTVMGTKCTHKDNNTSEFRSCGDFLSNCFYIDNIGLYIDTIG